MMNANMRKLSAHISNTKVAELQKATDNQENSGEREFQASSKPSLETNLVNQDSTQGQAGNKNQAAIDLCMRTGEVMKALFPEGYHLRTQQEFATFRLFDRLVGEITHFAQTGMTQRASLPDISLHATLIEGVVSSTNKS